MHCFVFIAVTFCCALRKYKIYDFPVLVTFRFTVKNAEMPLRDLLSRNFPGEQMALQGGEKSDFQTKTKTYIFLGYFCKQQCSKKIYINLAQSAARE